MTVVVYWYCSVPVNASLFLQCKVMSQILFDQNHPNAQQQDKTSQQILPIESRSLREGSVKYHKISMRCSGQSWIQNCSQCWICLFSCAKVQLLWSRGWSLQNVHNCAARLQTAIAEMEKHLEVIHSLDFDLPLKATSSNCSSPPSLILYTGLFSLYWQGRFSSLSAKE